MTLLKVTQTSSRDEVRVQRLCRQSLHSCSIRTSRRQQPGIDGFGRAKGLLRDGSKMRRYSGRCVVPQQARSIPVGMAGFNAGMGPTRQSAPRWREIAEPAGLG